MVPYGNVLTQKISTKLWSGISGTAEQFLPEYADSKYYRLFDAKSGHWHVPLDRSREQFPYNFQYTLRQAKHWWLRLPFGLKIASRVVLQERIDIVLRSVPNNAGIVDDILCHYNEETAHDAAVITLLETARASISQSQSQVSRWCILWRTSYPRWVQHGPYMWETFKVCKAT